MKLNDFTLPVRCFNNLSVHSLNMSEIIKYEKNGKKLIVSTVDSKYDLQFYDLETIEEMFMHLGLWLTDRTNVVNLNLVTKYDVVLGNLHFKNSETVGSVAKVHHKAVEKELFKIGHAEIVYILPLKNNIYKLRIE